MSKVRCSSCGAVFSSHKKNCPECGSVRNKGGARLKPGSSSGGKTVLIIILIAAIIVCLIFLAKLIFAKDGGEEKEITAGETVQENIQTGENEGEDENELGLPTIIDVDEINGEGEDENTPTGSEEIVPPEENEETTPPTVTVTDIKLNTLYDNANSCYDATFKNGEVFQFTAKTTPEGESVTWSIENTSIAQVDDTGKLTAVGSGMTTMTVSAGGHSVSCVIRVK